MWFGYCKNITRSKRKQTNEQNTVVICYIFRTLMIQLFATTFDICATLGKQTSFFELSTPCLFSLQKWNKEKNHAKQKRNKIEIWFYAHEMSNLRECLFVCDIVYILNAFTTSSLSLPLSCWASKIHIQKGSNATIVSLETSLKTGVKSFWWLEKRCHANECLHNLINSL